MKKLISTSLFLIAFVASGAAYAVVSDYIPVQGVLTDPDSGDPIDGLVDATFAIYNVATEGSALWSETYNSSSEQLDVDNGFFTVYLGKIEPIVLVDLLDETQLYLGITIGSTEMTPRVEIASVMFSSEAQYCAMATDFAVSGDLTVGGDVEVTGDYTYPNSSPKTGYLTVPAAAFVPFLDTVAYNFGSTIGMHPTSGDSNGFQAAVYLPDGVTVTAFSVNLYRATGAATWCYLQRSQPNTGTSENGETATPMATASFSSTATVNQTVTDSTITNPLIDNANYVYYTQCNLTSDNYLHYARITYTYETLNH